MSNLDDQLREAMREGDNPTDAGAKTEGAADPVVAEARKAEASSNEEDPHRRRNLGLLLGLLALGGGALSLVLGGSSDSLKFGRSVEEVLAASDDDKGRMLTVEGRLVHGSLLKRDEPCEYRFKLRAKDGTSGELPVRFPACIVPDNFRDVAGIDVDVTATGRVKDGVLTADNIATKCPTKYEMQQQSQLGMKAPHAAVSGVTPIPMLEAPASAPKGVSLDY
jgi:cytochrome c-type biogenesis protein CcmE